ncbi:MAG: tRNA pseudouridine(55) synthase TruB [Lachnospiraceae bacterium]|nr:tRNA pseudouridine(55) synthase TruB [Lachnospiraceae bacterium]
MIHGVINVYKEKGFTSHDVVAKLRGILKQKKIGHTGTLDPDAVGVLPVCLGSATKLCDMLTDRNKEYIAGLHLGCVTDTQDMTGKVLRQCQVQQQEEEIRKVIMSFQGVSEQIPPMYSALKVNGRKLYELAREGKEIERKPRSIQITEIEIQEMQIPIVRMRVVCSKGTYIRTLCHDMGEKLGCGGAMESLIRSRVGEFMLEDALTLGQIEALRDKGGLEEKIVRIDALFQEYPGCIIENQWKRLIENGNGFGKEQIFKMFHKGEEIQMEMPDKIRVYDEDGTFYGIYGWVKGKRRFEPIKMFLTKES